MNGFSTFFRIQLQRHLRSPALWFVLICTMIGARYFVPLPGAGYATLSVNNAIPEPTSALMGMQLGILTSMLLSPLGYIFLKAGPTRRHPWQVEDVTPSNRLAQTLGQGSADIIALWLIMGTVGFGGLILSFFRMPLSEIRPHETLLTLALLAAPSLALIAAVRTLLKSRPRLRGAWGDFVFFMLWMAGIIFAATFFTTDSGSAFQDAFGYAAAISGSTAEPVISASVGGGPAVSADSIRLDALKGTTNSEFLLSRLFWLFMAFVILVFSAVIYKPRLVKSAKKRKSQSLLQKAGASLGTLCAASILSVFGRIHPIIRSHMSQILSPRLIAFILTAISLSGFVLPFRKGVGPALMLIFIFLISRHSGFWQARNLRQYRSTLPSAPLAQFIWACAAAVILVFLFCVPSIVRAVMDQTIGTILPDLGFLILAIPFGLLALGYVTRSATMGRLIMLFIWYGYLNV